MPRREPCRRAAHTPPHRPQDHDGGVRAPRPRIPTSRGGPARLRAARARPSRDPRAGSDRGRTRTDCCTFAARREDRRNASPKPHAERESPAVRLARDTGFEAVAFGSGRGRTGSAPVRTEPQPLVNTAPNYLGVPHPVHGAAASFSKFGTTLGTSPLPDVGAGILLTARDVAQRLRVSTATVYALCRRGELRHYRVSNAIRVSEEALANYLQGR